MPTGVYAQYVEQLFGLGWPFLCRLLAAGLVSGLVAVLIGIPTLRLREDYLKAFAKPAKCRTKGIRRTSRPPRSRE